MTTLYSINGRRVGPEEYAEFVNDALAELQAQLDLTREARDKWKQLYREKSSLLREARGSNAYLTARVERADNATSDALDRAEKAEATIERVRAKCDRTKITATSGGDAKQTSAFLVVPVAELRYILDGSGDE